MWAKLFSPKDISTYLYYFIFLLLAIFIPVFLWSFNLPVAPLITTSQDMLFGLFGFTTSFFLLTFTLKTASNLSKKKETDFDEWLITLLPYLVYFFFLFIVVEFHAQSWDYDNYDKAAKAIINGSNPYDIGHSLYPPVFASTLASIYKFATQFLPSIGVVGSKANAWLFVFYIHHSLQFLWASLSYYFSLMLARRLGMSKKTSTILISLLFLANYPLVRNIHLNQITIFILFTVILSLVLISHEKNFGGGFFIALGGLIKIFPFALVAPLVLMKKWKALSGVIFGSALIFLLNTNFAQNLLLWKQFVLFYMNFPVERESSLWLRNSSVLSLIRHTVNITHINDNFVLPIFLLIAGGIALWFIFRILQRRRLHANIAQPVLGSLMDFSVASILFAPSAWIHHYLLAVPLAIFVMASTKKEDSLWVIVSILGIFMMPLFDVYPFSYIRLAGLLILLILSSPKRLLIGER